LNYGNPNNPYTFFSFKEGIRGITDVCKSFNIPVTGGNVSFYNETLDTPIIPTPVIGIVGLIDFEKNLTNFDFKDPGDILIVIGKTKNEFDGQILNYCKKNSIISLNIKNVSIDLKTEFNNSVFVNTLIKKGIIKSCYGISNGGILTGILKGCFSSKKQLGAKLSYESELPEDFFLLSESQSRYLVTISEKDYNKLEFLHNSKNIKRIGEVISEKKLLFNSDQLDLKKVEKMFKNHIKIKLNTCT